MERSRSKKKKKKRVGIKVQNDDKKKRAYDKLKTRRFALLKALENSASGLNVELSQTTF